MLSLILLSLSFNHQSFSLALIGIMASSIPLTFILILMTITLKLASESDEEYRKQSGIRELLLGIGLFLAATTTPFLLLNFSINVVFSVSGILFALGTLLIFLIKIDKFKTPDKDETGFSPDVKTNIFHYRATWVYIIKTSSSLILASFVPLIASSTQIHLTESLAPTLRELLWSVESAVIILSAIFYVTFKANRNKPWFQLILCINSPILFIALISNSYLSILVAAIGISLLVYLSFQQFRDDYILAADKNFELITNFSAFSMLQRNFIFFISPLVVGLLFDKVGFVYSIVCIALFQFIICLLSFIAFGKKDGLFHFSNNA